jgi:hypothetical protein
MARLRISLRSNIKLASQARKAFDQNAKDVKRLLEIHADIGGDSPGKRYGLEVLNKSALVLITAVWEAYCEDVAAEAVQHLIQYIPDPAKLPNELKKKVASELKAEKHELEIWKLAGNGWRAILQARVYSLTAERNTKLNTPKTSQINDLFSSALGLSNVSDSWKWRKMSAATAAKKLDNYVTLRGAVAHRGAAATTIKKTHVTGFFSHVKRLVSKTGGRINTHVKDATGKSLW